MPALVELDGVTRVFAEGEGERVVLCRVDARIEPGEWVALLGRSGSGKSTLLNLCGGLDRPTAGTVRVAGQDLGRMDERERTVFRRRHAGFLFQFFHLIPLLTVEENVRLPLELELGSRSGVARARRRAGELLARVGMADRAAEFPERLSGGEQQRVALARALVCDPALLLADEPTGNLDEDSARGVLDLLDEARRDGSRAILMATHSRHAAARCDRVLRLQAGRLREEGRPAAT